MAGREELALRPQPLETPRQVPVQAIDLARLTAAKTAVQQTVSETEAKAQTVVRATWDPLKVAVPKDSELRRMLE